MELWPEREADQINESEEHEAPKHAENERDDLYRSAPAAPRRTHGTGITARIAVVTRSSFSLSIGCLICCL
jgi:hypothetical protein